MKNLIDSLLYIFNPGNFEPHRIHFADTPGLLWALVIGNGIIALSYMLIPAALVYFVRKRKDLIFSKLFLLYGAFIILCGFTHIMMIAVFWYPVYGLEAVTLFLTGIVSLGTFFSMLRILPVALQLRSPKELEELNNKLFKEIEHHRQITETLNRKNLEVEKNNNTLLEKNNELDRMNKLMVGRELKMVELKKEIAVLRMGVVKKT